MPLAIIRDDETWTGNTGGNKLKCKKCGLEIEIYNDWSTHKTSQQILNYEFIYKTGFCMWCLIDLGYAS